MARSAVTGSDLVSVDVAVTDVNDNAPFLSCEGGTISCPTPAGSPFTELNYVVTRDVTTTQSLLLRGRDNDLTAANTAVEFSVTSVAGVSLARLSSQLRVLRINPALVRNSTATVTVRNTAPPQLSGSATINVVVSN